MDPLSYIMAVPGIGPYTPYIAGAVTICAAVATMLPAPADPASVYGRFVYKPINWIALNFGHAKNATAP